MDNAAEAFPTQRGQVDEYWDEPAWQTLAGELDVWLKQGHQASFWWRDDDAGSFSPAFKRLLSLATDTTLPLGLAVVPTWLTPEAAEAIRATRAPVAVIQHGFAHANHETEIQPGEHKVRPSEYGTARSASAVFGELTEGMVLLRETFGSSFLSVFVPPWNRIVPQVIRGLPRLGYRGLSTFGPRLCAEPVPGLIQVNCHADPILWREGKRFAGAGVVLKRLEAHLVARRGGHVDPSEPTGLLTHHREMDPMFWSFLETLLGRLRTHPAVIFSPLPSLFLAET